MIVCHMSISQVGENQGWLSVGLHCMEQLLLVTRRWPNCYYQRGQILLWSSGSEFYDEPPNQGPLVEPHTHEVTAIHTAFKDGSHREFNEKMGPSRPRMGYYPLIGKEWLSSVATTMQLKRCWRDLDAKLCQWSWEEHWSSSLWEERFLWIMFRCLGECWWNHVSCFGSFTSRTALGLSGLSKEDGPPSQWYGMPSEAIQSWLA